MSGQIKDESELTPEEESILVRLIEMGVTELEPKIGTDGVTFDLCGTSEGCDSKIQNGILNVLAEKGYLTASEHDRTLSCPRCCATHVYSKYACPSCQSIQVRHMELLEHTFCGFMGDRDKFTSPSGLTCPNCKTNLSANGGSDLKDSKEGCSVIGSSFECEKCNYRFDRPNVLNVCQKCGANFDHKRARYGKVYNYRVTNRAKELLGVLPQLHAVLEPIDTALSSRGFMVKRNAKLRGMSGAEHIFTIVGTRNPTTIVIDATTKATQDDIISLLGKKMDVRPTAAFLLDMSGNEEVSALGKVYDIMVINGKEDKPSNGLISYLDSLKTQRNDRKRRWW